MSRTLTDPLAALQKAMFGALTDSNAVQSAGGGTVQVFDRVSNETFPYIVIGEDNQSPDDTECGTVSEVYSTVRVYSRAVGKVQAKQIAGAVRWALDKDVGFTVDGFGLLVGVCTNIEIHTHDDGLTTQAEINFSYRLTPA